MIVGSKIKSVILSVLKNLDQLNEEPTMIVEEMIDSAVAEYKIKLLALCSEAADAPLTPASSALVVSGLHEAANAASKAALRVFIASKDEQRDVIRVGEDTYRVKCVSGRKVLSPWGPVRMERRLFQNARDETYFPLDAAWGMSGEFMMAEVREAVAFACLHVPPVEAVRLFGKCAQFRPHRTQMLSALERIEARVRKHQEALDRRIRERETAPQGVRALVGSMDGANVPLKEPGKKQGRPKERPGNNDSDAAKTTYKNAMAGCFSFYGAVKEGEKCPQRLRTRYVAHMPEDLAPTFKRRFEEELSAAEALCAPDVSKVILCDGARSIWTYIDGNPRFAGYETLIDYWHAVEHLSLAAEALFGKGTDEAKAWYNDYADKMLERDDGASAALNSMAYYARTRELPRNRRADLKAQQTFFERNKARMTYADFRRRGLPIGSGPVEAACKTLIKQRMCQSGMRWSREGGQRILDLRCYAKSNRWDAFWEEYMNLPCAA